MCPNSTYYCAQYVACLPFLTPFGSCCYVHFAAVFVLSADKINLVQYITLLGWSVSECYSLSFIMFLNYMLSVNFGMRNTIIFLVTFHIKMFITSFVKKLTNNIYIGWVEWKLLKSTDFAYHSVKLFPICFF